MMDGWGFGFDMMGGGWMVGIVMLFFGLLVLAGLVLLAVWAVRATSGHQAPPTARAPARAAGHDEAIAIVKRRYAAGEITKEQYDEITRTLNA
jgi:putative membrane protein